MKKMLVNKEGAFISFQREISSPEVIHSIQPYENLMKAIIKKKTYRRDQG